MEQRDGIVDLGAETGMKVMASEGAAKMYRHLRLCC